MLLPVKSKILWQRTYPAREDKRYTDKKVLLARKYYPEENMGLKTYPPRHSIEYHVVGMNIDCSNDRVRFYPLTGLNKKECGRTHE